jgi:hypothetical protein
VRASVNLFRQWPEKVEKEKPEARGVIHGGSGHAGRGL